MYSRRGLRLGEMAAGRPGYFDFQAGAWVSETDTPPAPSPTDDWRMPEAGRWYVEPDRGPSLERQLLGNRGLVAVGVLMLGLLALCRFVLRVEAFALCMFLPCFGIPLLATLTVHAVDKSARAVDRAQLFVEDPKDPDVCPVLLTLYRDGLVTGEDAGVAMFEDSTLTFTGNLCSFVIGRRDVAGEPWRIASRSGLLPELDHVLFLRTDGPSLALRLIPAYIPGEQWPMPEAAVRFLNQKRQFRHGPGGPERSFYPPLTVSPRLLQDPVEFRHLIWLQMLAFIYFALMAMLAGLPPMVGLAAAGLCALAVPLLRPRRNRRVVAGA